MGVVSGRVAGALVGQAVGDALGGPADGLSAYDITRRFQKVDDYFGGKGKFSSATRLGFMHLSAFLSRGLSEESASWAHEHFLSRNPPDPWASVLKPESWPALGAPPMRERGDPTSTGPELVAKLCPLGTWAACRGMGDVELLSLCKLVASPTHAFRPAILSAWVAAKVVREVSLNHDAYSRPDDLYDKDGSLLSQVIEFCRRVEEKMTPEENHVGAISERLMYARARLQSRCPVAEFAALNGHSRDAFEMSSFCIFAFMNRPEEFKSVVEAIGLGGRTSVRGAVLGAMIGAFAGIREVPAGLAKDLEGSDRIMALARELPGQKEAPNE